MIDVVVMFTISFIASAFGSALIVLVIKPNQKAIEETLRSIYIIRRRKRKKK